MIARRARVAVCFSFALLGLVSGVWAARIPTVKASLQLGDGQLSLALLAVAVGLVTGMQVAGRLTDRLGSARVVTPAGAACSLAMIPAGFAPNLAVLIVVLFVWGLLNAFLDVSMNTHAVEVERAYGRPLMSSFHGMYSAGGLVGAAAGALSAWLEVSPGVTFTVVTIPLAVLAVLARSSLLPSSPAHHERPPGRRVRWHGRVVFMGAMAFAGLLGEGSAGDWSAVYLHNDLGAATGLAAIAFAAFSTAMTVGRFAGDRLALRFGPVALVRASGVLAAAGLGLALLLAEPAVAIAGFGLFGLGLATMVPQVFSAAGEHDPARAGAAIAQVATLGYAGLMLGPVIIGGVAEVVGLRLALAQVATLGYAGLMLGPVIIGGVAEVVGLRLAL
ncbi:MFS transporter, partial [Nonomuraea sp. NPDC059194]|uniref:MFS transporter n=1 Tax=Nonomuraea sp. NPDC059194 TaxID=3346764 RepID=UPI0036A4485C